MATPTKPNLEIRTSVIAGRGELSDPARHLLRDDLTPDGFLHLLEKDGLILDALGFIAHWLGKREAVWWGCQCVWHVSGNSPDPRTRNAMQTVVNWVLEPNEANRRHCERVHNELTAARPVGALALAAFGSGGSLSLPDLPEVPAPPTLTATTVAAALPAAAARAGNPERALRQFLHLGLDVAHGDNLWT